MAMARLGSDAPLADDGVLNHTKIARQANQSKSLSSALCENIPLNPSGKSVA
jgi:hypothetical protein